MSEAPRGVPLSELTESVMSWQRERHDSMLAEAVRQIEALDVEDSAKRMLVEKVRALLAAELDGCERTIAALVARGMRTDEPLH